MANIHGNLEKLKELEAKRETIMRDDADKWRQRLKSFGSSTGTRIRNIFMPKLVSVGARM